MRPVEKDGTPAVDMKDLMSVGQGCAVSEIVDEKTALFELKQRTVRSLQRRENGRATA